MNNKFDFETEIEVRISTEAAICFKFVSTKVARTSMWPWDSHQ